VRAFAFRLEKRRTEPESLRNPQVSSLLRRNERPRGFRRPQVSPPAPFPLALPSLTPVRSLSADDIMKCSAYLSDTLLSRSLSHSYSPSKAPFHLAARTDMPVFEAWSQPGQEAILARFGMAMQGISMLGGGGAASVLLPDGEYASRGQRSGECMQWELGFDDRPHRTLRRL
jgi:hypothetical protein